MSSKTIDLSIYCKKCNKIFKSVLGLHVHFGKKHRNNDGTVVSN